MQLSAQMLVYLPAEDSVTEGDSNSCFLDRYDESDVQFHSEQLDQEFVGSGKHSYSHCSGLQC
jgi:hypothetical protein